MDARSGIVLLAMGSLESDELEVLDEGSLVNCEPRQCESFGLFATHEEVKHVDGE